MQTATYIHEPTREAIRARALTYLECDIPPELTLRQARRAIRLVGWSALRYPDDPAGDYETTDGGW